MFDVIRIFWRVLFAPLWVLWNAYGVLWWAFDDAPARESGAAPANPATDAPRHGPTQDAAFQVVDSRPRPAAQAPPPRGALRAGFAGSLAASAGAAFLCAAANGAHILSEPTAWAAWLWSSAVAFVGSIWLVKRSVRKAEERRRASWWWRTRNAAGDQFARLRNLVLRRQTAAR